MDFNSKRFQRTKTARSIFSRLFLGLPLAGLMLAQAAQAATLTLNFYDATGANRDVLQNHLLQVLAHLQSYNKK